MEAAVGFWDNAATREPVDYFGSVRGVSGSYFLEFTHVTRIFIGRADQPQRSCAGIAGMRA